MSGQPEPPPQQPTVAGLPAAQAGPMATIAAIVIATVMQQYTANSNHSTTTTDLDSVKAAQTDLSTKFSALSDQLSTLKTLQATEQQLDARITTAEQGIIQNQADIRRNERRAQQQRGGNNEPNPTPYLPTNYGPQPQQTSEPRPEPRHR
jgi:septal ring factor EnvC (AmiA/AmiB activator)